MEGTYIRLLVPIALTESEFEVLRDYADQTQQDIGAAVVDLMLIGATLGPQQEPQDLQPFNEASLTLDAAAAVEQR